MPVHEFVQAAVRPNDLGSRPQHEMESISEDYLGTTCQNFLRRDALNGSIGANRHEYRRLYRAATKSERSASRRAALMANVELHLFFFRCQEHGVTVTEETVLLTHGVSVGIEYPLFSGKRRDQHQQG